MELAQVHEIESVVTAAMRVAVMVCHRVTQVALLLLLLLLLLQLVKVGRRIVVRVPVLIHGLVLARRAVPA